MAESPSSPVNLQSKSEPVKTNVTPQPDPLSPQLPPPIFPSPSFPYYVSPFSGAVSPPIAPSFRTVPPPAPPHFSVVPNYDDPAVQPPGVSSAPARMSGGYKVGEMLEKPHMLYQVTPNQSPQPAVLQYDPMLNSYAAIPHLGLGLLHYPPPYMPMVPPAFAPDPLGAVVPCPFLPRVLGARSISPLATRPYSLPSVTPVKPQIIVFVSKISATVESDFMLSLLQLCGPVKSWKRGDHPINGTPLCFGFCEFATAEGALRALRLLDKFNVDGQELELNVNQSTKEYLEQYIEKKSANLKKLKETQEAGTEKEDRTASGAEKSKPATSSGSKERQDSANFGIVTNSDTEIDRLASEMLAVKVEERLKTRPLSPPPPPAAANGSENSNSELTAKSKDADTYVDMFRNDETKDKNEDMTSEKSMVEQDRLETSSPGRSRRRSRDRERDLRLDKVREIERYEEEERERKRKEREQRWKIEEAKYEYANRLKEWERVESRREKQRRYEDEYREERECRRKRDILEEEEYSDDNDGDDRKRGHRSEQEKKRKRRLRELENDLADRQREEEEITDRREKRNRRLRELENDLADRQREEEEITDRREKRNRRLRELENDLADRQREEEEITDRREKRNRRLRELENDFADMEREEGEIVERREERSKRLRELENDFADKQREEEDIAESKKREEEDIAESKKRDEELKHQQRDALKLLPSSVMSGSENHMRDVSPQIGIADDSGWVSVAASDTHQSVNGTGKKLRFDLVGSKKKTLVPSVFHKDDYDAPKEKKMGPQVPIDHSTEKLQSVHPTVSGAQPPNLAAAAEFAKPISNVSSKEEDSDKKRGRYSHDRSNQRDRGRVQNNEDANWNKDDAKDKVLDRKRAHRVEKAKTPDNKKHLDAKQLIDMIPKTKEELFSYEINWAVYDKHELHEIIRPWISKKIVEFMGDEEPTLVDYIESTTKEHVKASEMVEMLLPTLDEETEMFVLKMWMLLIFEIKKVETGLSTT